VTARKLTTNEKAQRQRYYSYWADGQSLWNARLALADPLTVAAQQQVREALVKVGNAAAVIVPHFNMPAVIPIDPMALLEVPRFSDEALDRWAVWANFDPATNALLAKLYAGDMCAFAYEHPRRVDAAPALVPSQLFVLPNVTMDDGTVKGEGYSFFDVRIVNQPVEAVLFGDGDTASPTTGARALFRRLFAELVASDNLPQDVTADAALRLKSLCLQRFPFYEAEIRRISAKTLGTYLTAFKRDAAPDAIPDNRIRTDPPA
jgi:hypothetical protein